MNFEAGLFESLELDQNEHRTASRKAVAVANKRARDRFLVFLTSASGQEDYKARLSYIEDDLHAVIAGVVEEYGGDVDRIKTSVLKTLAGCECGNSHCECGGDGGKRTASVHESRRPKLCPYHREVMDISLAAGDP